LHIVTKVGGARDAEGGWYRALAPEQLRQGAIQVVAIAMRGRRRDAVEKQMWHGGL